MRTRVGLWELGALVVGVVWTCSVEALEEQFEDLSASVEVASVFSLSLSKTEIVFHDMEPGKTKVLGEGEGYHELTCHANSGRSWYLKAHLASLKAVSGGVSLPPMSLKWKVRTVRGGGESVSAPQDFQPFTEEAALIYASRGDDTKGQPVVLQFEYSLTPPLEAPAGNYIGQIVYTMGEAP